MPASCGTQAIQSLCDIALQAGTLCTVSTERCRRGGEKRVRQA